MQTVGLLPQTKTDLNVYLNSVHCYAICSYAVVLPFKSAIPETYAWQVTSLAVLVALQHRAPYGMSSKMTNLLHIPQLTPTNKMFKTWSRPEVWFIQRCNTNHAKVERDHACRLWKPVASHGIVTLPTNHGITTVPYRQIVHQRPVVCAACSGALRTARCAYFGGSYFLTFLDWQHVFLAHTLNKWIIDMQCEHARNTYPVHPVKYWYSCFLTQICTQVSTQLVSKEVAARSEICHPAGKRRLQTILRIIWAGNIQHFGAQIWCPGVPTPGICTAH